MKRKSKRQKSLTDFLDAPLPPFPRDHKQNNDHEPLEFCSDETLGRNVRTVGGNESKRMTTPRTSRSQSSYIHHNHAGLPKRPLDSWFGLETNGGRGSRFGQCPLCQNSFPHHILALHAANCCNVSVTNTHTITNANDDSGSKDFEAIQDYFSTDEPRESTSDKIRIRMSPIGAKSFSIHSVKAHAKDCRSIASTKYDMVSDGTVKVAVDSPSLQTDQKSDCIEKGLSGVLLVTNEDNNDEISTNSHSTNAVCPQSRLESTKQSFWKNILNFGGNIIRDEILPSSEPIPGLYLYDNFINYDEECYILQVLDGKLDERHKMPKKILDSTNNRQSNTPPDDSKLTTTPWKHCTFNGTHRGKRWGVHCDLRRRHVYPATTPLPAFLTDLLLPRLQNHVRSLSDGGYVPNEANAIDYRRAMGDYLAAHVDDRRMSKEPIANLSIGGDCYMTYRWIKGVGGSGGSDGEDRPTKVLLKRRTMQVLTGKARYEYTHGIENEDLMTDRRISITIRESPIG